MSGKAEAYKKFLDYTPAPEGPFDPTSAWIWVEGDPQKGKPSYFTKGKVTGISGGRATLIADDDGRKFEVDEKNVQYMNPSHLDGVPDMSMLSALNEGSVLHNLRQRYAAQRMHTYSGLFLVVVNPYQFLPIYSPEVTKLYEERRRDEVAPHVFAVADEAYRAMRMGKNQSILITGESGAGKTENTKKVIQYYATVFGRHNTVSVVGGLEDQMMKANPILEAFGNAKTMRNDNSSRFGKFIQVQFTRQGHVAGMKTQHYLLERSRICGRLPGERSFHIFYQLLAGASEEQRRALSLGAPDTFKYLQAGKTYKVESINDAAEFKALREAMDIFGMAGDAQEDIFRAVATILWLGNLEFGEDAKEQAFVSNKDVLAIVAGLMNLAPEVFETAILKKTIIAGGTKTVTHQKKAMASASRDALARAMYDKMFDYIVRTINNAINHEGGSESFIGVLDIAGFEIFETNSFEQLCINYTNEKLQQFFNHHMFVREQEEYALEKIQWEQKDFGMLLRDTIEVIDRPGGNCILGLLDEQCVLGTGTNEVLTQRILEAFRGCPALTKNMVANNQFILKHYAGKVNYTVDDWITKNKNPLHDDLINCVRRSSNPLVQRLFSAESSVLGLTASAMSRQMEKQEKGPKKNVNYDTVASQYRLQLTSLMSMLESTEPHFIRCLKPNPEKRSWVLEEGLVIDQLRCNGVLEGIRISRLGYPLRVPYLDFVKRFEILCPAGTVLPSQPNLACAEIMKSTKLKSPDDYQLGKSKVFFKANVNAVLEKMRNEKVAVLIKRLQRAYRRYRFIKFYRKFRGEVKSASLIQKNARLWVERKNFALFKLYTAMKPTLEANKLEKQMRELSDAKAQLEHSLAKVEAEKAEALSAKKGLEGRIEQVDRELQRQASRAKELEKDLSETEQELALCKSLDANHQAQAEEQLESERNAKAQETEARIKAQKEVLQLKASEQALGDELAEKKGIVAQLEKTKSSLTSQVKDLTEQVARLEEEVANLKKANKQLEADLAATKAQLDAEMRAKAETARNLQKAQEDLTASREEIEQGKQVRAKLERAMKQIEAQVKDLEGELESREAGSSQIAQQSKRVVEELQQQLEGEVGARQKAVSENAMLTADLGQTRTSLGKEKSDREKLEREKVDLKRQLDELAAALEAEKGARANVEKAKVKGEQSYKELSDQLEAEKQARARAEKATKGLQGDLAAMSDKCDKAEARATEVDERAKDFEVRIQDMQLQMEMDQRTRLQLQKAREAAEAKVIELQDEMEDMVGKKESVSKSLVRETALLREQIEQETQARQSLEQALREERANAAKLQQSVQTMVDKVKYETLDRDAKARDEQRQAEIDELRASRDKLDQILRKGKDALSTAEASVQDREARLAKTEQEGRQLREQLDRVSGELKATQLQLATFSEKARKAEGDLSTLQTQLEEEAVRNNQKLAKAKKDLEEKVQQMQDESEALVEEKKRAEARLKAEIAELQAQVEEEHGKVSAAAAGRSALEAQIAEMRAALEAGGEQKLEQLRAQLNAQLTEAQAALETSESNLSKTRSERDQAQKQAKSLQASIDDLNIQLKSASDKARALAADSESAVQRARMAEAALAEAQRNLAAARAAVEESKASVEAAESARQIAARKTKEVQDQLESLQTELEEAQAEAGKKQKVLQLQAELEAKNSELEEALRRQSAAEAAAAAAVAEKMKIMQESEGSRTELASLQRQVRSIKAEKDDAVADLEAEKTRSKDNLARLKKRNDEALATATQDFEREKAARFDVNKQKIQVQKELDEARAQLAALLSVGRR